jgi:hypothetical protein
MARQAAIAIKRSFIGHSIVRLRFRDASAGASREMAFPAALPEGRLHLDIKQGPCLQAHRRGQRIEVECLFGTYRFCVMAISRIFVIGRKEFRHLPFPARTRKALGAGFGSLQMGSRFGPRRRAPAPGFSRSFPAAAAAR